MKYFVALLILALIGSSVYAEAGISLNLAPEALDNGLGATRTVLASVFSDRRGCYDNNLYDGGMYYAELSVNYKKKDFSSLGKLKKGHKLRITYKGKSVIATKADVGAGGPHSPKIDLHINLAKALGFPYGLANVVIEDV